MILTADEERRLFRLIDEDEVDGYLVVDRQIVNFAGNDKQRLMVVFLDRNDDNGTRYVRFYRPDQGSPWDITTFSGPDHI